MGGASSAAPSGMPSDETPAVPVFGTGEESDEMPGSPQTTVIDPADAMAATETQGAPHHTILDRVLGSERPTDGPTDHADGGISIENTAGPREPDSTPDLETMTAPGFDDRIDDGLRRGPNGVDVGGSLGVDLGVDTNGQHDQVHAGAHGGLHVGDSVRVEGEIDTPSGPFAASVDFDHTADAPPSVTLDAFGQHVEVHPDQVIDAVGRSVRDHLPDPPDLELPDLDLPDPPDPLSPFGHHTDELGDSGDLHPDDPGWDEPGSEAMDPDEPDDQ